MDQLLEAFCKELRNHANEEQAAVARRFFKTGAGEYGEGDLFLGVRVPVIRRIVKTFPETRASFLLPLLQSPFHEERMLALLILVRNYGKGAERERGEIFNVFWNNRRYINSWDLIDASAEHIVGAYLEKQRKRPLYQLAKSKNLWDRRMAIMATFHYIKRNAFTETLKIAEMLVHDHEDLIHKAVGWMLREVGKRDVEREEFFLRRHYRSMPRTMLRYAIEKLPESKRQAYLKGEI
jgi:3-methyladenine DNA glycosylase AlkD